MKTSDTVVMPKVLFPSSGKHLIEDAVPRLRGWVKATVEEEGKSEVVFEDHNLIVDGAKMVLANLLATAPATYKIDTMQLGTMGHDEGAGILVPVPPEHDDDSLNDPSVLLEAILDQSIPPVVGPPGVENTVMFTFVLEKDKGNGTGVVAYTEAGLFTGEGDMFARETFPAIVKTSVRKITFEWSIIF